MLSHVYIGVANFPRALPFYRAIMQVLGVTERFCEADKPWAGWQSAPDPRPLFIIGIPFNSEAHQPGNGQMFALTAKDRATVDMVYQTALANGGKDEGAPGLRPHYHANYYGAYVRDTEGNKLCFVCHDPD
ncbi:VOC family protein [Leeia sp. TBRC 13508]|uniref:VOC family protein n=1 Tax=Leeia speluncae TaxID=2884804 RepID=A0ABS8D3D4_9NEIS|nr:VOC family protein [Leeia speluncae]MCB6182700.1 VOC family protein [Leeia speluncae]